MRNPFVVLQDLLAGPPLQVATVVTSSGGVSVVELPGGGTLQVRGTGTAGDNVFIRGDLIEGPAPSLTLVQIEV